jgi:hypothetical protein
MHIQARTCLKNEFVQVGLRHEVPKPDDGADALGFASLTPTYKGRLRQVLIKLPEKQI